MQGGQQVAELGAGGDRTLVLTTPDAARAAGVLAEAGLRAGTHEDGTLRAPLPDDAAPVEDLVSRLVRADVRVRAVDVRTESLEDRFVALTGEGFEVRG